MQIKKVIKSDEAREKLFDGFKTVADVVSATAGPGGRNIAIQESWGAPKVTKDGVTVESEILKLGVASGLYETIRWGAILYFIVSLVAGGAAFLEINSKK